MVKVVPEGAVLNLDTVQVPVTLFDPGGGTRSPLSR